MNYQSLAPDNQKQVEHILGHLNFSTGAFDPRFFRELDDLFHVIDIMNAPTDHTTSDIDESSDSSVSQPTYRRLCKLLLDSLDLLSQTSDVFRNCNQARAVVLFVFDHVLPAYREFHKFLLWHQTEESLFTPFFIARCMDYALEAELPFDDFKEVEIINRLNEYTGYRPVAVLESHQRMKPYSHEFFNPQTLYLADVGVAKGKYFDIVSKALKILSSVDESILRQAQFYPENLLELAVDVRALDFDHPVSRRLNYPFGEWDTTSVDTTGKYRRFILHQTMLDAILSRVDQVEGVPKEELAIEAATVLAGTMLMGSCINGAGPGMHDSSVTLASLLPIVANYRNQFYDSMIEKLSHNHKKRLLQEKNLVRQAFGGARQHFNLAISRLRASQLQNLFLARMFARMGYTEQANARAEMVACASARTRCKIFCGITKCHFMLDNNLIDAVIPQIAATEQLMYDGIECGALLDPWNILGFGNQFPLFQSVEDATTDQRSDELINVIGSLFKLYSRVMRESAIQGRPELKDSVSDKFQRLAQWWDKFATMTVSSVESISGSESWDSAIQVYNVLKVWHDEGKAVADMKFWRPVVESITSTKSFAILIDVLLDERDYVAAMALLINWLCSSENVPIDDVDYSIHPLILRWMMETWFPTTDLERLHGKQGKNLVDGWQNARKFLDYLEANAEEYWNIPVLDLAGTGKNSRLNDFMDDQDDGGGRRRKPLDDMDSTDRYLSDFDEMESDQEDEYPDQEDRNIYRAAYENVSYKDSTDDGNDSDTMDNRLPDPLGDFELTPEVDRISDRLRFWITVARLWKMTAVFSLQFADAHPDRDEMLAGWCKQAQEKLTGLERLAKSVEMYQIELPNITRASMQEYEQRRYMKESLLDRIVSTIVEVREAFRLMGATQSKELTTTDNEWDSLGLRIIQAIFRGNTEQIQLYWKRFLQLTAGQSLLYVPFSRGGKVQMIANSKGVLQVIQMMLSSLPRLGLYKNALDLMILARRMEQEHPINGGAITRFDKIYEVGCQGIVRAIIRSTSEDENGNQISAEELVLILEPMMETLLACWLKHAQNIRVSTLEDIGINWPAMQKFIIDFGKDLLTPVQMGYGNIQAILHQGVDNWLRKLQKDDDREVGAKLMEALDKEPDMFPMAVRFLEIIYEGILEYYGLYMDYNSTTTQSDEGNMIYTFLDFLRTLCSYDRLVWHLQPVMFFHTVLIREGLMDAADLWRKEVKKRCSDVADALWDKYLQLQKRHGMLMTGIGDRLSERFTRPLEVEQLAALIKPAIDQLNDRIFADVKQLDNLDQNTPAFEQLLEGIEKFSAIPTGNGFEPPSWLDTLEKENLRVCNFTDDDNMEDLSNYTPLLKLDRESLIKLIARLKLQVESTSKPFPKK